MSQPPRTAEESRQAYKASFDRVFAEAQASKSDDYAARVGPFTLLVTYYDGPGIQIYDGAKRPVLTELIRDPEDAIVLLNTLNSAR